MLRRCVPKSCRKPKAAAAAVAARPRARGGAVDSSNPYRGYSVRVGEAGDTMLVLHLRELSVYPPMKFKNSKQEEYHWRTVRDVKLTLPYAAYS